MTLEDTERRWSREEGKRFLKKKAPLNPQNTGSRGVHAPNSPLFVEGDAADRGVLAEVEATQAGLFEPVFLLSGFCILSLRVPLGEGILPARALGSLAGDVASPVVCDYLFGSFLTTRDRRGRGRLLGHVSSLLGLVRPIYRVTYLRGPMELYQTALMS